MEIGPFVKDDSVIMMTPEMSRVQRFRFLRTEHLLLLRVTVARNFLVGRAPEIDNTRDDEIDFESCGEYDDGKDYENVMLKNKIMIDEILSADENFD